MLPGRTAQRRIRVKNSLTYFRLPRSANASPTPSRVNVFGSGTNSTRTPVALEIFVTIKSSLWAPADGTVNEKAVHDVKDNEELTPVPSKSIVAPLSDAHLPAIVSPGTVVENMSS
jgi:hypothetical protein